MESRTVAALLLVLAGLCVGFIYFRPQASVTEFAEEDKEKESAAANLKVNEVLTMEMDNRQKIGSLEAKLDAIIASLNADILAVKEKDAFDNNAISGSTSSSASNTAATTTTTTTTTIATTISTTTTASSATSTSTLASTSSSSTTSTSTTSTPATTAGTTSPTATTTAASTAAPTSAGGAPTARPAIPMRIHQDPERRIFAFFQGSHFHPFQHLNMKTWRKHLPDWKIVVLNDTTVRHYIPDLPDEFFRLYPAAKSDVVRSGALYHHGGLYMDFDMIILNGPYVRAHVDRLFAGYEIISYGDGDTPMCDMSREFAWSSNWMGASKQNMLMETWWENVKSKITRACTPDEFKASRICCNIRDQPAPAECHIPWGYIEHLKVFDHDPEGPRFEVPRHLGYDAHKLTYCANGLDSFLIHSGGEVFWEDYSPTAPAAAACYQVPDTSDLACPQRGASGSALIRNFFGRGAFHLFASNTKAEHSSKSVEAVLKGNSVLGEAVRRSLLGHRDSADRDADALTILGMP